MFLSIAGIKGTHCHNFQASAWAQVGVALESVLGCHLAQVSAWAHEGSEPEGWQLGARTEK